MLRPSRRARRSMPTFASAWCLPLCGARPRILRLGQGESTFGPQRRIGPATVTSDGRGAGLEPSLALSSFAAELGALLVRLAATALRIREYGLTALPVGRVRRLDDE